MGIGIVLRYVEGLIECGKILIDFFMFNDCINRCVIFEERLYGFLGIVNLELKDCLSIVY